jgi:hypothetical protein
LNSRGLIADIGDMQFHVPMTLLTETKKKEKWLRGLSASQFYDNENLAKLAVDWWPNGRGWRQFLEELYHEASRPYFKVYPQIQPMLSQCRLDVDCENLVLPLKCIGLQFSVGNEPCRETGFGVESAIVYLGPNRFAESKLCITFQVAGDYPGTLLINTPSGSTVEDQLRKALDSGDEKSSSHAEILTRIVAGLCIISTDPRLARFDVLKEDREEYESESVTPGRKVEIEARAMARGKNGWIIGDSIDTHKVMPHERRGCWAIYWVGKGRNIPLLRTRSGCFVLKNRITNVPQGYLDMAS